MKNETSTLHDVVHHRPRGFASRGDIFVLILLFLFSSMLGSTIVRFLGFSLPEMVGTERLYPDDWGRTSCLIYAIQMGLMLSLTLLYRLMRGGKAPLARFSMKGLDPLKIIWGIALMLSVSIVFDPLLQLVDFNILEMPDPGRGPYTILSVIVLAPFFEEFLCRGILLEGLRTRYGATSALIGSSLFFALIHVHPVMMVNAFILGFVFAFLCLRTSSIWPCFVLHAFNNGLALLLMWAEFPGEAFDGRPMADLTLRELLTPTQYLVTYAVALVVVLWSGWRVVHWTRILNRRQRENEEQTK